MSSSSNLVDETRSQISISPFHSLSPLRHYHYASLHVLALILSVESIGARKVALMMQQLLLHSRLTRSSIASGVIRMRSDSHGYYQDISHLCKPTVIRSLVYINQSRPFSTSLCLNLSSSLPKSLSSNLKSLPTNPQGGCYTFLTITIHLLQASAFTLVSTPLCSSRFIGEYEFSKLLRRDGLEEGEDESNDS
ncbi:hypothetical protein Tco_1156445 [Tanacetum coccineum]